MSIKFQFRFIAAWLLSVYGLAVSVTSQAAEMVLAESPLFLGTRIDPNIFFMVDDSGSMDWEILTVDYEYYLDYWRNSSNTPMVTSGLFLSFSGSGCGTGRRNNAYYFSTADDAYPWCSYSVQQHPEAEVRDWRVRSVDLNIMYYDPSVTYIPWVGFPDAVFTAARSNPESSSDGYNVIRNLTGFRYDVYIDDHSYNGNGADGPTDVSDTPNGLVDLFDSHTTYTVGGADIVVDAYTTENAAAMIARNRNCSGNDYLTTPPYSRCFGTTLNSSTFRGAVRDAWGRTLTEIKQNVANWYQYHRRRSFVAKAAIAKVISENDDFRFGLSLINEYDELFKEVPAGEVEDYTSHNTELLESMFEFEWERRGTPLRRGLERVGRYYSNYYANYADPITSACQQNYSVLFTDGYWNGGSPYTSAISDEDGDGTSDSVADVAHYFYTEDLSTLPNDVPTTTLDQNNNQHMVSFTVAFGVEGNLVDTDNDNYPNPELAGDDDWGGTSSNADKIDDLWHAAFNSKAYFVSAQAAGGVANAITAALFEIADRVGSSASVATNTGSLNAGSHLFQARFDSSDWKGQLLAFQINDDGTIQPDADWDAATRVNNQNYDTGREILAWNADADVIPGGSPEGQGIAFRFPSDYNSPNALTDLTTSQIASLMTNAPYPLATADVSEISTNQAYGEGILDYFRGDGSNAGVGLNFRYRNSVLGDIINSDPKFVGDPNFRYPDAMEAKSYADFIADYTGRDGVVYAGANDGMLHGFDEDTGDEVLAFMPSPVFNNIAELATDDYIHRNFVDAGPNIVDAFLANMDDPSSSTDGQWRTILSGGLGGGGQAIYSLDVTDPSIFDESFATNVVLWEFNDGDDADLGYTYGRPQIAKMANGQWAAVFGNGYNNTVADGDASTTGNAVLYIVDIETGDLIKKIDTGEGAAGTPNGLATPLLVDQNSDFIVDYIYAGDLLGNMWKFDVTSALTSGWEIAYSAPLFTTDANQPITSQPQAAFHPDNLQGFMIYFGTGQYLETTDNDPNNQPLQAFYGIWDKNESILTAFDSDDLLVQTIDNQYDQEFDTDNDGSLDTTFTLRDVSKNSINFGTHMGFKLGLIPVLVDGIPNTDNFGERQISNAIISNGRIIFTSLQPSQVECEFGGSSFLMEIDFRSGGALDFPAFDLNNDGEYDGDDTDASGRASDVGIMPTVSLLGDGAQDIAFGSGSGGDIEVINITVGNEAYGRQSWNQLE